MNSFKTIEAARDHARKNPIAQYIVEIEPGAPGVNRYICCSVSGEDLQAALGKKPMAEIKKVVATVVDLGREALEAKAVRDKAEFEKLKADGTIFRAVEYAPGWGAALQWARRLTNEEKEKEGWAEWYRDFGMYGVPGGDHIKVNVGLNELSEIIGDREPDGSFPGCNNNAWIVSEEEWAAIVEASNRNNARRAKAEQENLAAEAADIESKVRTGYCFSCESWCYGDCGNYHPNPDYRLGKKIRNTSGPGQ